MTGETIFIVAANIKAGDVICNGSYDIFLIEDPHFNDTTERWMAKGRRWLPSRKAWQDKVETYGWAVAAVCKPKQAPTMDCSNCKHNHLRATQEPCHQCVLFQLRQIGGGAPNGLTNQWELA